MGPRTWQIWIDRGGTFTDCVGRDPESGALRVVKVLSADDAATVGIRRLMGLAADAPIPACEVRMGTTLATNALLERRGAATGLLITRGFADLLQIGDQSRPELFALDIVRPPPLHRAVVEVDHRLAADGSIVDAATPAAIDAALRGLLSADPGLRALAVVLIHAYLDGDLERQIGARARALGFDHVSLSHEVDGELGLLGRGDTTVVDAYLTPLLRDHLALLRAALPRATLRMMQSSGDLTDAERFRGRDAILSGPSGGAVAVAAIARRLGLDQVIGFDMGGTSTDVCRWAGELERTYEARIAEVRVRTPMLAVHTVAAGGGSICAYDGHRFQVGPESAGARPGPLCYGDPAARELTVTDVSAALGRLVGDRFPIPIDPAPARAALEQIAARMADEGDHRGPLAIAGGFFEVAIERMAAAIRTISVARGHDLRDHAMIVFGGAGGQHACALARALGVRRLIFHPLAGVLSAYGIGVARVGWHGEADAGRRSWSAGVLAALAPIFAEISARGRDLLAAHDRLGGDALVERRRVDLRYRGTEAALTLTLETGDNEASLSARFAAVHRREYGYDRPEHPIEVVTARVALGEREPEVTPASASAPAREQPPAPRRRAPIWAGGALHDDAPVYWREDLGPGAIVDGPALILEATATIALDPGWRITAGADAILIAEDHRGAARAQASAAVDPVLLEIFAGRFMALAEQMGVVLRRTALSTNIRERLDFSCAVFDGAGNLVANAPHIPVHLGAMSESIRGVLRAHPRPGVGDVYVTNDPAAGGSHLPDITVIAPVHGDDGRLRFFTASRGHHADIGGIAPGSMPPSSERLADEGVVLRALPVVRGGRLDREMLLGALGAGPWPARRPLDNLADIEAQIAASRTGARLLGDFVDHYGPALVDAYMGHIQDHAAAAVHLAIQTLPKGQLRFTDAMDDGTPIAVTISAADERLHIDFTGTGAAVRGNLNAPRAVTVAAVLYVLRLLAGRPIPLNSGCLRAVDLTIPPGSLLDPPATAAVVAGNVETSQRIVDVLLGALGLAAASQGTMNNLTFGTSSFGYYETIGGGAGASASADGASGVHTHMTNTRITDPEVLESRFPVRLREFSLRRGSGGAGRHRGGDGLTRELEFLADAEVSIVSERRVRAPFGLAGGEPGAIGENHHNGRPIAGRTQLHVRAGDRVRVDTPGGGGFGQPVPEDRENKSTDRPGPAPRPRE